ncbi:MAG: protein kinase [Polyangiaceae bacterium]|nr:protein kinase [Polyangiaceae bacterium]
MRYPSEATYCFIDGASLEPLQDPRIGTLLSGRYVIEDVIGEGGMATVYRARHKLVDRPVAVKIMNPMLAVDPVVRERFRREARSAQMLAHPNIIEIFDQGDTEDGSSFIVMELLHGESLAVSIRRGPMNVDRALNVMIQIARGIARAHDLDVIHRDIKPENIFLCKRDDGTDLVKILDFGIAKSGHYSRLTGHGELFGTPQYMAPERIMGGDATGSSDLYALGVVFFEMLTATLPFDATNLASFFTKHMIELPPPVRSRNPRVPEALDALVVKTLAKDPNDRPIDAHRIHHELLAILHQREAPAPPTDDDAPVSNVTSADSFGAASSDLWMRRLVVFERMLTCAFGSKDLAPDDLTALLDEVGRVVQERLELRNEGALSQGELEEIETRGREKRTQLGCAVEALGIDASKAKEDLRAAHEALAHAEAASARTRDNYLSLHKDVLFWEGRSAFAEPWPDLSAAYRAAASAVDEWAALRAQENEAQVAVEGAGQSVNDLDFQIRELRGALARHEQDLDQERAMCRQRIEAHGKEADALETKLFELTTQFCKPLRTIAELAPLFKELDVAAA